MDESGQRFLFHLSAKSSGGGGGSVGFGLWLWRGVGFGVCVLRRFPVGFFSTKAVVHMYMCSGCVCPPARFEYPYLYACLDFVVER